MIATRCLVADRFWARFKGLLGRRSFEPGEGLLIVPAGSVHMLGMRFAIDAVFIDSEGVVLRVVEGLRPWRAAGCRGARNTLELPAGAAAASGLQAGDSLIFEPAESSQKGPGQT